MYSVIEDYSGLYEDLFLMEIAYNNIKQECMKQEFTSILYEDNSLLEAVNDNFFLKIKELFVPLFRKIRDLFKRIKDNLVQAFGMNKSFAENTKRLIKSNKWIDKKVDNIPGTIMINENVYTFMNKYFKKSTELSEKLKRDVNLITMTEKQCTDQKTVIIQLIETCDKEYENELQNFLSELQKVDSISGWTCDGHSMMRYCDYLIEISNNINNHYPKLSKACEDACNEVISNCDKKEKNKVDIAKKLYSICNKELSSLYNTAMKVINRIKKTINFFIKNCRSIDKENKKKETEDKKQKQFDKEYERNSKKITEPEEKK